MLLVSGDRGRTETEQPRYQGGTHRQGKRNRLQRTLRIHKIPSTSASYVNSASVFPGAHTTYARNPIWMIMSLKICGVASQTDADRTNELRSRPLRLIISLDHPVHTGSTRADELLQPPESNFG